MVLHPIPAFADNYIWVLHNGVSAVVVDPGEADGVLAYVRAHNLQVQAILVTHHHPDHTAGALALREATGAKLFAPAGEWLQVRCERVDTQTRFSLLDLSWQVLEVPGHTLGHVAYVAHATHAPGADEPPPAPWLFCGDTLFSGGCGRVFEGTHAQMLASLDKLAALPDDTWVCCTHEYTLSNLRFAMAADPHNPDLAAWQIECQSRRARDMPTLPSQMGRERAINPFLRVRQPALQQVARAREPQTQAHTDVAVFTALRNWKDEF